MAWSFALFGMPLLFCVTPLAAPSWAAAMVKPCMPAFAAE